MKSYSLTVGRLYILPSIKLAFHYIYFLPKDELYLFEIWDAMFNLVYLFLFFHRIGNPPLDSTLHLRLVRMTCKSVVFTTSEVRFWMWTESHVRVTKGACSPPAQRCPFGLSHGCQRTRWAGGLGCHVSAGCEGHDDGFGSMTWLLWGLERKESPITLVYVPQDATTMSMLRFQHCFQSLRVVNDWHF